MRVHFAVSDNTGGGHLRGVFPAQALSERGHHATAGLSISSPPPEAVVIHRPLWGERPGLVRRLQAEGVMVLVDEDDALERVQETENAIAREVCTPQALEAHAEAIRMADGLVVTTDYLAEMYGQLNPRVTICPNYLPRWVGSIRWHWPLSMQRRPVLVGWTGITQTHAHDLRWVAPVAERMLRGALFTTVGDVRTTRLLGVSGEAYPYQHDMRSLYKLQARADIGIVPLKPCAFNEAKSWLKALEYMTLGKPVVVTDLPEQRKLVKHGETGFLASTPEEFADCVQMLVHDEAMRQSMGQAAREHAGSLAIEANVTCWEEALGAHRLLHAG